MNDIAPYVYIACCYLVGAIPSGFIVGRWLKGIDIRTQGSGNMGATNVFRLLGKGPGLFVLAVDIAKGALAVTVLAYIWGFFDHSWLPLSGGLAAVLGHNYTCFLKFKGGKGVAASAGVFLGLAPFATLSCLILFMLAVTLLKMISVGSIAAALVLPAFVLLFSEAGQLEGLKPGPVFWLAVLLAVFVWVRHIPNIRRIVKGEENRFQWSKRGKHDR